MKTKRTIKNKASKVQANNSIIEKGFSGQNRNSNLQFKEFKVGLGLCIHQEAKRLIQKDPSGTKEIAKIINHVKRLKLHTDQLIKNKIIPNNLTAKVGLRSNPAWSQKDGFDSAIEYLSYIESLIETKVRRTPRGRPSLLPRLAVMLYYAIHVAEFTNSQIISIGEFISHNGPLHRKIDTTYSVGTYTRLKIPSTDYGKVDDQINSQWIKHLKFDVLPKITKQFFFKHPDFSNFFEDKRTYEDIKHDEIIKFIGSYPDMMSTIDSTFYLNDFESPWFNP